MKFDMQDLNPATTFPFDDGSGSITLRICSSEDLRNIRRQTRKRRIDRSGPTPVPYEDINNDLEDRLLWDHCIVAWEGIEDAGTGKPIECTVDNKVALMTKCPAFAQMVAGFIEQLAEVSADEAAAELKNSMTSRDG